MHNRTRSRTLLSRNIVASALLVAAIAVTSGCQIANQLGIDVHFDPLDAGAGYADYEDR